MYPPASSRPTFARSVRCLTTLPDHDPAAMILARIMPVRHVKHRAQAQLLMHVGAAGREYDTLSTMADAASKCCGKPLQVCYGLLPLACLDSRAWRDACCSISAKVSGWDCCVGRLHVPHARLLRGACFCQAHPGARPNLHSVVIAITLECLANEMLVTCWVKEPMCYYR